MEIVLTGKNFSATDAAAWGLISRVVEGDVVAEAVKLAGVIASKGRVAVQSGKEGVNAGELVGVVDVGRREEWELMGVFGLQRTS